MAATGAPHVFPLLLVLLAAAAVSAQQATLKWWQTGVVYQVYPRSFRDSDGDGVGDIKGITEKLDHFVDLGVAAVWISPIYKSPMKDNGYDISDFLDIDSTFGTMDDFDELLQRAHDAGLKIVMDFVPNHSSDEHEWFQKATNPDDQEQFEKYRDYYVWHPGKAEGANESQPGLPNNWTSWFGGSMWEWHEGMQMYYLHQFGSFQPDLNYSNPEVVEEMKEVLRFWLEKGVDGFRMDAVPHLFEWEGFPDEEFAGQYTKHHPKTYEMVQEWRALLESLSNETVMMTECYGSAEEVAAYYGNDTNPGAHFSFNFQLIYVVSGNTAADVKNTVDYWLDTTRPKGLWNNWVEGNHDQSRVATRVDPALVDGMNMLVMLLSGTALTYNGEEIGMEDYVGLFVSDERDPERTPYQWDNSTSAGFSSSETTWLPVNPNYATLNLAQQKAAADSHYAVYKALVAARSLRVVQTGTVLTSSIGGVFAVGRYADSEQPLFVLVNFGSESATVDLPAGLTGDVPARLAVYVASVGSGRQQGDVLNATVVSLAGYESMVLLGVPEGSDAGENAGGEEGSAQTVASTVFGVAVSALLALAFQ